MKAKNIEKKIREADKIIKVRESLKREILFILKSYGVSKEIRAEIENL